MCLLDTDSKHLNVVKCSVGEGNANTVPEYNTKIVGSNRIGRLVAIQNPLGFASIFHLDVKYEVSTFLGPSNRSRLDFVKDFEGNANVYHLPFDRFHPKIVSILEIHFMRMFYCSWNFNSILVRRPLDESDDGRDDDIKFA